MNDLTIKTAKTKPRHDTHLVARTFESVTGETVFVLLRSDGREKECDHLVSGWIDTVQRTLVAAEEPAYERLESALKELNGILKGTQLSEHIKEVNALVAILDTGKVLHVSQAGRAEAYLVRDGSTVQITEGGTSRSNPQFLYISNGDLQKGDVILLSTERLLRSMTPAQMAQAARKANEILDTVRDALEADKEIAALACIALPSTSVSIASTAQESTKSHSTARRQSRDKLFARVRNASQAKGKSLIDWKRFSWKSLPSFYAFNEMMSNMWQFLMKRVAQFTSDLHHPTRKRKAHLLLLAGSLVVFIGIWSAFQFSVLSQRSQSRSELKDLVEKINGDLRTSENRQLMGDLEAANAILNRAEEEARSVMQNESGLFRTEALDILDRIRAKRESINNIVRLTPTIVANLTSRNPDVSARGLVGIERGRMIVYDRQNLYSIIVNAVDEPQKLDGDNLILDGAHFPRFNSSIYMTKENRLIELIEGQPTAMKTDDPAGWLSGPDMETYIRFLYILSPQNNQILKYERLSNRYSAPTEYNVNGNLEGALDMTIDSDVYILKPKGEVVKLFRGEQRNFTLRNLPSGAIDKATKIFKPSEGGNLYFLDPENARIIVTRTDNDLGESLYLKQYVLEGDQIGALQDLYVDPEESKLLILDEKRLYSINLQEG